jgi:hypothetical protein
VKPLQYLILLFADGDFLHLFATVSVPLNLLHDALPAEVNVVAPQAVSFVDLPLPIVVFALQLLDGAVPVFLDELHVIL